jgi:hypothetical protein
MCDAEFSLVLGSSSGTGTISFHDTSVNLPYKGTLMFSDGQNTVSLRNLYVDKPRIEYDAVSGKMLSATVYDRRFAWQWGYIAGRYNQPDYTNTPTEEVPLKDLIQLCLEALGEVNPVLINIPVIYPKVEWDPELPATALEDLCDEHGLVIGLDAGINSFPVVIAPYDYDRNLPSFLNTTAIEGVSSAIKPKEVIFFGGRDINQRVFHYMVPVGEDLDGSIKRIENLSFAPADWGDSLRKMFTDLTSMEARELADKCVFKWYAIDFDLYKPEEVLPLLTNIVDIIIDEGVRKRDKPYVKGAKVLWDGISFAVSPDQRLSESLSIDKNLGLVKFNELVIKPKSSGLASDGFEAATITLTAAFEEKSYNGRKDFFSKSISIPGGTEIPAIFEDSSVVMMYKRDPSTGSWVPQNAAEVNAHADKILNQVKNYYLSRYPKIYTYPGIFPIGAWGGIRNVVWSASSQGGASTEIHKDMEVPKPLLPDYTDREIRKKFKILWRTRKDSREVRKVWPFE